MFNVYVVEGLIFLVCLIRCSLTDLREKKIENKIIIILFVSKLICWMVDSLAMQEYLTLLIENVLFSLLLLFLYFRSTSIGAGDVKLLCVSKLYFNMDDTMKWLLCMGVLLAVGYFRAFRREHDKNVRTVFAPYVLISVVILYIEELFC